VYRLEVSFRVELDGVGWTKVVSNRLGSAELFARPEERSRGFRRKREKSWTCLKISWYHSRRFGLRSSGFRGRISYEMDSYARTMLTMVIYSASSDPQPGLAG
jgi:hypothetical protein